ncbi:MAG: ROK family protein, partial [Phycisphaerae bacterium]|nr:ROK family protein [Phycisphaerae bacterium]
AQGSIPTEGDNGPEHVFGRLAELGEQLLTEAGLDAADVLGVGVGTPGPLSSDQRVVLSAPNLPGWRNIPLQQELQQRAGLPVRVFNDADAATYGEFRACAAEDGNTSHIALLTLGTGIGGGLVLDGRMYRGPHGAGSELGHMIVEPGGRPCGCGQRGCLEQYASATAIRRRFAEDRGLTEAPGAEQIFAEAAAGDGAARAAIDQAVGYLATACVNLVRTFDPQRIILGGGVAAAGDALVQPVRDAFATRTWNIRPERVRIEAARLGNNAGFIGAAGLFAAAPRPDAHRSAD